MKITKLITFNIISFILMISTLYLYFGGGIGIASATKVYFLAVITPIALIGIYFTTALLVNLSYIVVSAKKKKNLLRISSIIISILFISSVIKRIIEIVAGEFCFVCWINTVLYLVLVIINILILSELFQLVRKLNKHQ